MTADDVLEMWTVYDHPRDMPDCFVARLFLVKAGAMEVTGIFRAAPTLDEVRAMLPLGLYRLPRSENDEPQIVEVWL